MGTIYLAEDTRLGRQVALKFIHSSRLKDEHAKERLFQEGKAAGAIRGSAARAVNLGHALELNQMMAIIST
jgi:serine/threonine protein kinase